MSKLSFITLLLLLLLALINAPKSSVEELREITIVPSRYISNTQTSDQEAYDDVYAKYQKQKAEYDRKYKK